MEWEMFRVLSTLFCGAVVLLIMWWSTLQEEKHFYGETKCPCCTLPLKRNTKTCPECYVDLEGR